MTRNVIIFAALIAAILAPTALQAAPVKQSRSGICHDQSSPYYAKTRNYQAYNTLKQCLAAGGRLPKEYSGNQAATLASARSAHRIPRYNRDLFEHWIDADGDCINTRHELLMKQSVSTVDTGRNRCTAYRGRWNDPYTGKVFYNAQDLDIDHLVPLAWAWSHGAHSWSESKRRAFANDESNLFAVQASVNREKGASGPLEWLPPNRAYHCQYVLRFQRIAMKYRLTFSAREADGMKRLRESVCK